MAGFTFTKISDSGDGFFSDFSRPSINDGGTVAFFADFNSEQEGIFIGDGTTPTQIVDDSGSFNNISLPSINNDGTVAFRSTLDNGGEGIFTSNGATTTIADTNGSYSAFGEPVINDKGTVAFNAFQDSGGEGIFTNNGNSTNTVADSSDRFQFLSSPSINNDGTVAFWGFLGEGDSGIFTGNGTTNTIADTTSSFVELLNVTPDINDEGLVVFTGREGENDGIFISDGTNITTIADTSGPFSFFSEGNFINNNGEVAFTAGLDNLPDIAIKYGLTDSSPRGIYTGPNPETDKVIAVGDELSGSTVIDVVGGGLNNQGQIAFLAELEDDTIGVFRADPVPTPVPEANSSLGLLAVAAFGLINYYWRYRMRSSKAR